MQTLADKRVASKHLINALVVLTTAVSIPVTGIYAPDSRYANAWVLPLIFLCCFTVHLHRLLSIRASPFRIVFVVTAYLRYVASPVLITLTRQFGTWERISVSVRHVDIAVGLMALELVACTAALAILGRNTSTSFWPAEADEESGEPAPSKSYCTPSYNLWPFVLLGGLSIVISPVALQYFRIPIGDTGRQLGVDTDALTLVDEASIMLAVVAKHFLFLAVVIWAKRRHDHTQASRYVWLAIATTIANCIVFFGSNRLTTIFVAASSILIFVYLFPAHKARLSLPAAGGLAAVFVYMTEARNYWDPYSDAQGTEHALNTGAWMLTHYLGGLPNVAISASSAEAFAHTRGFSLLAYDLLRPIPVLNATLGGSDLQTTNQLFNQHFYQSLQEDVILPSIGQGYFHFGFWFSWLVPVALVITALLIESVAVKVGRVEYLYVSGFALMRIGTLMGSNATIQVNEIAVQFLVPLAALWISTKFIRPSRQEAT